MIAVFTTLIVLGSPNHDIPIEVPVDTRAQSVIGVELDNGRVVFPNIVQEKLLPQDWQLQLKTNFIPDVTIYKLPKDKRSGGAYSRKREFHNGEIYVDGEPVETINKLLPQGAIVYLTQAFPEKRLGYPAFDKDGKLVAILYGVGDTSMWLPMADKTNLQVEIHRRKRQSDEDFLRALLRKEGF